MASSAPSPYFRITRPRRYSDATGDISRGISAGEQVGKLLGGLATAIKGAQQDALANKLMNTEDAPRAALVNAGGTYQPGGPQPGGPTGDGSTTASTTPDPDPDPVANPAPAGINPDYEPYSFVDMPDNSVSNQVAQSKAASSLQSNAQPGSVLPTATNTRFVPNAPVSSSVPTAGTQPYSGGKEGLSIVKEIQAMQAQKATMADNQAARAAKLADLQAKATGTGPYAVTAAINRARLAAAQNKLNPTVDLEKNPPPAENFDSEPAINQAQLIKTIDTNQGKGFTAQLPGSLMEPDTIPDPKNPGQTIPNPAAVTVSGENKDQVTLGPKNKRVTMTLDQAKIYAKQINAQRLKQGQPLLRVPGEDQSVGGTPDNPYPAQNKLDAKSRARGTWVRLPNGTVWQVP